MYGVTYVASDANLSDDPSRRSSDLPNETLEGLGGKIEGSFRSPGPSIEGPVEGGSWDPLCGDPISGCAAVGDGQGGYCFWLWLLPGMTVGRPGRWSALTLPCTGSHPVCAQQGKAYQ